MAPQWRTLCAATDGVVTFPSLVLFDFSAATNPARFYIRGLITIFITSFTNVNIMNPIRRTNTAI